MTPLQRLKSVPPIVASSMDLTAERPIVHDIVLIHKGICRVSDSARRRAIVALFDIDIDEYRCTAKAKAELRGCGGWRRHWHHCHEAGGYWRNVNLTTEMKECDVSS